MNDIDIRKELEKLKRHELRDRAMSHIAADDSEVHNANINNSRMILGEGHNDDEYVTRTQEEEAVYQRENVLTRRKVYDAVNAFPERTPLLTLILLKECSTMRREML